VQSNVIGFSNQNQFTKIYFCVYPTRFCRIIAGLKPVTGDHALTGFRNDVNLLTKGGSVVDSRHQMAGAPRLATLYIYV